MERGQTFGLSQGGRGFVVAPGLREHRGGERVHLREVSAITRRVQRGRGLGDVLAHDRHVADLAIAEAEAEVGETDGA